MSVGIEVATPLYWFTEGYDYSDPKKVSENFVARIFKKCGIKLTSTDNKSYWGEQLRPATLCEMDDILRKEGLSAYIGTICVPGTFEKTLPFEFPEFDEGNLELMSSSGIRNLVSQCEPILKSKLKRYQKDYQWIFQYYLEAAGVMEENEAPLWWLY